MCCHLTWLGIQDAVRKKHNYPSQTPSRAWAGTIIDSDGDMATVLVSEEKWKKTKNWIKWVLETIDNPKVYSKRRLKDVGVSSHLCISEILGIQAISLGITQNNRFLAAMLER